MTDVLGTGRVLSSGSVTPAAATATSVVIARKRAYITLYNNSDTYTAYFGPTSSVTSSNGYPLLPGGSLSFEHYYDALYVYTTGSGDIRYLEVD